MKYREYLYTAQRHLATCQTFFNSVNWDEAPKKENLLNDKINWLNAQRIYLDKKIALLEKGVNLLQKTCIQLLNNEFQLLNKEEIQLNITKSIDRFEKQESLIKNGTHLLKELDTLLNKTKEQIVHISEKGPQLLEKENDRIEQQLKNMELLLSEKEIPLLNEIAVHLSGIKGRLEKQNKPTGNADAQLKDKDNLLEESIYHLQEKLLVLKEEETSLKEEKKCLEEEFTRLKEKNNLLKDIYYLSGYILEAFIVFIVYEIGYRHVRDVYKKDGKVAFKLDKHDVDEYIKEFTLFTKIDYYPVIKHKTKRWYRKKFKIGKKTVSLQLKKEDELFLNNFYGLCAIEQHHFFDLFELVKNNRNLRDAIYPSLKGVPLFFGKTCSKDVKDLIRDWKSGLRYSDSVVWDKIEDCLNENTLKDLLITCQQINNAIKKGI